MTDIEIATLHAHSPEIATCAQWRIAAFSGVLERTVAEETAALVAFTRDQSAQVGLVAKIAGVPCGTCLLVPSEIDPCHAVSPWLAGLYVAEAQRGLGVGQRLVKAIEAEARRRGHPRLYLYTDAAVDYYAKLGWSVIDRVDWKGYPTALMRRDV